MLSKQDKSLEDMMLYIRLIERDLLTDRECEQMNMMMISLKDQGKVFWEEGMSEMDLMVQFRVYRQESLYGSVSFPLQDIFLPGGDFSQWITLFESPEDDIFDGEIGCDDEDYPKILVSFSLQEGPFEDTTEEESMEPSTVQSVYEEGDLQVRSMQDEDMERRERTSFGELGLVRHSVEDEEKYYGGRTGKKISFDSNNNPELGFMETVPMGTYESGPSRPPSSCEPSYADSYTECFQIVVEEKGSQSGCMLNDTMREVSGESEMRNGEWEKLSKMNEEMMDEIMRLREQIEGFVQEREEREYVVERAKVAVEKKGKEFIVVRQECVRQVEKAEKEKDASEREKGRISAMLQEAEEKIKVLCIEKEKLQKEVDEEKEKNLKGAFEVRKMKEENAKIVNQLKVVSEEALKVKDELKVIKKLHYDECEEMKESYEKEIEMLRGMLLTEKQKVKEFKENFELIEIKNKSLIEEISSEKVEKDKVSIALEESEKKFKEAEAIYKNDFHAIKSNYDVKIRELEECIDDQVKQFQTEKEEIYVNHNKILVMEKERSTQEIELLKKELEDWKESKDSEITQTYEEKLHQGQVEMNQSIESIAILEKNLHEAESKYQIRNQEYLDVVREKQKAEEEIESFINQKTEIERKYLNQEQELNRLAKENDKLQMETSRVKKEMDNLISKFEEIETNNENGRLRKQIESLLKQLTNLQEESSTLRAQLTLKEVKKLNNPDSSEDSSKLKSSKVNQIVFTKNNKEKLRTSTPETKKVPENSDSVNPEINSKVLAFFSKKYPSIQIKHVQKSNII